MSVANFAPEFRTPEFVAALKELIKSSKYLYRDANLNRDELVQYQVGAMFREATVFDCTARLGGIVGGTRFVVVSSAPRSLSRLSERSEWGLATLGANELFKVIDVQVLQDKTQITLAHVPAAFEAYFRSSDSWLFDKWTVPQAQQDLHAAVGMPTIAAHVEEDWRRRIERPPGMNAERRLIPA